MGHLLSRRRKGIIQGERKARSDWGAQARWGILDRALWPRGDQSPLAG